MIEPALVYVVREAWMKRYARMLKPLLLIWIHPVVRFKPLVKSSLSLGMWTSRSTPMSIKAYSAGAFIALAGGTIYMAPGSVIGAATPMMMSPWAGLKKCPMRFRKNDLGCSRHGESRAEQGGHDPNSVKLWFAQIWSIKLMEKSSAKRVAS